jgi:hypothetical protein
MFARKVSVHLKPNCVADFNKKLEKQVIPLLLKQKGFEDEIAFVTPTGSEALAFSFWDKTEDVESYKRTTYPEVLKILQPVIEGSPQVETYEVATSTFPKYATA